METNQLEGFNIFMQQRLKASTDFVEGKFESLKVISIQQPPATIFPPIGICIKGIEEVNAFNKNGAEHFLPGAKNIFEVMHQEDADEHLAYWTGIQRSAVRMKGRQEVIEFNSQKHR
ncbi:MAG: hypothetical protein QM802_11860 [Agriterribacter sp.]